MAADPGLVALLRDDFSDIERLREKPMFGGMGLMLQGHMVAGVMSSGALLYRPGKPREVQALALPQVTPMAHGGRRMGGFVMLAGEAAADDETRAALKALSLQNHAELPPKE